MLMQTSVGQQTIASLPIGQNPTLRSGQLGDAIVSELHGRYYETAYRQNLFYAANTAATAVSVALTTTYTGLCVSNPAGNTKNVVLTKLSYALSVAPAAISSLGVITGYLSTGVTTHTTPLIPASTFIGTGPLPTAKADAACTLVGTPAWTMPIMGGFTAAALPSTTPAILDLEGSIIIPPGGYAAIGALTAVTGFAGIFWEEVPV
jgi:hypothetical protein